MNLFINQNTDFLISSSNELMLRCTKISFALLYFGLRKLSLYPVLFLIAVTVPLHHTKEQYILKQKDLNKVHFTTEEHLHVANFLDTILMFA